MTRRTNVVEEIRAFRRRLEDGVAEQTIPTAHGAALLCSSIPSVYDVNFLRADRPASASVLAAEAEATLEGFLHRRVIVEAEGRKLVGAFAELGWTRSTHLVLAHTREPDRRVDTSSVREIPLEQLAPVNRRVTLAEPQGDERLAAQLFAAKRRAAAVVPTRFFAAFAGEEIAAYCELRNGGEVAQIEDVNTLPAYRGRGLGRTVVQHALDEGRASARIVFLEALDDDWPKDLYARLGFDQVDERHLFLRAPSPLTRIRVRTPRLELRLATVSELRALAAVALAGIHDPSFMPFEFPWTDSLTEESLLAFHQQALQDSRPERWQLNLVAFLEGRPVGTQGLNAERFAETRTVSTGSWLGREWQGRGFGTEMRAGVLQLAFAGLGAERAVSGSISRNPQSLGVSRKLGYSETGSHLVSPRGEPLEHLDLELLRRDFSSPVPVELDGLDGALQLLGAS
jgi:RimJ/RimL family protein N-acetyltransferase/ribosomal protein S18 acetylase RimI-like enzyme